MIRNPDDWIPAFDSIMALGLAQSQANVGNDNTETKLSKIKFYIFLFGLVLIVSAIALAWIVNALPPTQSGPIILFYTLLLVFAFSLFSLIGFYFRRLTGQREWQGHYLALAARQGLWLSAIFTVSMFLLSQGWFNWLNAILLILIFTSLEAYLFVKKEQ